MTDGPAEAEACGVLIINLTAIASNWSNLAKRIECAAVVKGNAYGCGIGPITGALAKTGCKTFFVSNMRREENTIDMPSRASHPQVFPTDGNRKGNGVPDGLNP